MADVDDGDDMSLVVDPVDDVVGSASCAEPVISPVPTWASWPKVSKHPAPVAWIVRTALNANVSRWRRRRREVLVADPAAVADLPAAQGVTCVSVDPQIMAALMRLPARQRQVVAPRLFLDLDIIRTAEVLGIASGTVQSHQGRAIAALRGDLISNAGL